MDNKIYFYRTSWTFTPRIEKVEVEKYTDSNVWVIEHNKVRMYKRISKYDGYFPSWGEAYDYLVRDEREKIAYYEKQIGYRKERLAEIEALKEEDCK